MDAKEIFEQFFNAEKDEVRRVRQGKGRSEVSVVAQEAWSRLSIADRTIFNIFANAREGRHDATSMLGREMTDYIAGRSAEDVLSNPDFVVCLKLYLGDGE